MNGMCCVIVPRLVLTFRSSLTKYQYGTCWSRRVFADFLAKRCEDQYPVFDWIYRVLGDRVYHVLTQVILRREQYPLASLDQLVSQSRIKSWLVRESRKQFRVHWEPETD
jgi:hypothetical protein